MKPKLTLTEINIFPIKSLGGIKLQTAKLAARGLESDRRWMLVDDDGQFMTQRNRPIMSQFSVSIQGDSLKVQNKGDSILIPTQPTVPLQVEVNIWKDRCTAHSYSNEINEWFTDRIGQPCRLVFMPDDSNRPVDPSFAAPHEQVSFADGFPTMIIGESSLADLNSRLETPVSMDRFRTNLVFSGGSAFAEDSWKKIRIGSAKFLVVKPCARCVMTTLDPDTVELGVEPLRTLATYRKQANGVMFGQNLLHAAEGVVTVGDVVEVID